jgi:ubiquinone/menaquinone biosynthesis C-methylase UbiE
MGDPLAEPGPWNAVAAGYDTAWSTRLVELNDRACDIVAPRPSAATARLEVLEVGAGPGHLAMRLAVRVSRVVAIDFADKMIARLREHLASE